MLTVWKYQLDLAVTQHISMPVGAEILTVQVQHGVITLWANVNTDNPVKDTVIRIIGTGHQITGDVGIYIGSVQIDDFVWHIFEGQND